MGIFSPTMLICLVVIFVFGMTACIAVEYACQDAPRSRKAKTITLFGVGSMVISLAGLFWFVWAFVAFLSMLVGIALLAPRPARV